MSQSVSSLYEAAVADGRLQPDARQQEASQHLESVRMALARGEQPIGVYLYGPVGRGKSMLMDLLMEAQTNVRQRRVHFHAFMEEVHQRMHTLQPAAGKDPMLILAEDFARDARLFCFDEFYITNIADAMLLGRLFQMLFKQEVTVCATSNWPPEELFQGGINRDRFMPFIHLINKNMLPVDLAAGTDFRTTGREGFPLLHVGPKGEDWLQKKLKTYGVGRRCVAPPAGIEAKLCQGTALWCTFETLCGSSVGRDTYLQLAAEVETLLLEGVPSLPPNRADAALRFVTLVDIFYEAHTRLVCTLAVPLSELCPQGDAAFPFQRTVSRLHEMQRWGDKGALRKNSPHGRRL
jgi:cell division protein ZapE